MSTGRATTAAAAALALSAGECLRAAGQLAQRQLNERPYATVGVAAGVGFLVAGGFAAPLGRSLVRFGAKLAAGAATRSLAMVIAGAMVPPANAAPVADDDATR